MQRSHAADLDRVGALAADLRPHRRAGARDRRSRARARHSSSSSRASVAAMSTFSVAPTETSGNSKTAPFSPEARWHGHSRRGGRAPPRSASSPFRCRSARGARPMAQPPAARPRHGRPAPARPEHQDRGPHLAHHLVIGAVAGDRLGADHRHPALLQARHLAAERVSRRGRGADVGEPRRVGQRDRLVGEQRRRHQRQAAFLARGSRLSAAGRRARGCCPWFLRLSLSVLRCPARRPPPAAAPCAAPGSPAAPRRARADFRPRSGGLGGWGGSLRAGMAHSLSAHAHSAADGRREWALKIASGSDNEQPRSGFAAVAQG